MLVFVYSEQDLRLALGQVESSASADHRPTQDLDSQIQDQDPLSSVTQFVERLFC